MYESRYARITQWTFANSPNSLEMETMEVATMAASRHEKKKPRRMLLPSAREHRGQGGEGVLPCDDEDAARL